ncbi:hypothetical protein SCUCBS95973_005265 [Sporothrix curviconia]|uniref:FAD-binding PCMH-type domain-containing protein n=1 Tax=Sporothrix curviconia TaxID=1260050 RepID=A0ABP0BVL1_9PEZI
MDGGLLHPAPLGAVCYPPAGNSTAGNSTTGPRPSTSADSTNLGAYNLTECLRLLFGSFGSRVYIDDPLTVLTSWPQGETCDATLEPQGTCTRGGFPEYVVNVTTVKQVQAAVNFARNENVRLVIKNTGHDFVGRSTGAGALSVWTHHLKNFEFLPHYTATDAHGGVYYSGMAARVGVGLEAWELYQYMARYNMTLVVPGGQTVGAFGGWMAGGGHSSLGSMYGMGSDQVLALQVVTADGRFVTVNATENADLFYALRGGGPGSYGIVTSAIVRAFPAVHVSETRLSFQVGNPFAGFNFSGLPPPTFNATTGFGGNGTHPFNFTIPPFNFTLPPTNGSIPRPPRFRQPVTAPSVEAFWQGVSAYFRFGQQLCDGGGTGYSYISQLGGGFGSSNSRNGSSASYSFSTTLELPGMTASEAQAFLQPLFDTLNQLGIHVNNSLPHTSASWGPGPQQGGGDSPGNGRFGTRLFPRHNWQNDTTFQATMTALRSVIQSGYSFHGVQVAPSRNLPAVQFPGNSSVNPAFRDALIHGDVFDFEGFGGDYDTGASPAATNRTSTIAGQQKAARARFEAAMHILRAATPGSGAYVNEADPDEPNWQQSFWGAEYKRLLTVKRARDPWNVFWAPTTVGSEGWSVRTANSLYAGSQNGRLCQVTAPAGAEGLLPGASPPSANGASNVANGNRTGNTGEPHGAQGVRIAASRNKGNNVRRVPGANGAANGSHGAGQGSSQAPVGAAPICSLCNKLFVTEQALAMHVRDSPRHGAATATSSKHQPRVQQQQPRRRSPARVAEPAATPLDRFFTSYAGFPYNRALPPVVSFRQLRRFAGWYGDFPTEEFDEAKTRYRRALIDEVRVWFGNENDLASWHQLCRAVGIREPPPTMPKCEQVLRQTHVNIIDLIQWGRDGMPTGRHVRVYATILDLSDYTFETRKFFPADEVRNDDGETNIVLRHLLRRLIRRRVESDEEE